jgi:hypothetical protein
VKKAWKTVKVGERATFFAALGHSEQAGGPDLCTIDIQPEPPGGLPGDAVWMVEATVESSSYVGAGTDRVTLGIRSRRLQPGGTGAAARDEVQAVTLTSDQRHVLDLLTAEAARESRCSNVLLEITAERRDDPAAVGDTIDYDVWLVHKDRSGQEWRERRQLDGAQRERVFVRFRKVGWSIDGNRLDASRSDAPVEMRTVAEIAGWIRPDGLIDLELGGFRGIGSGGWHIAGGIHRVTVADGETTAFVLPLLTGTMTLGPASAESRAGRGVTVAGDQAAERCVGMRSRASAKRRSACQRS